MQTVMQAVMHWLQKYAVHDLKLASLDIVLTYFSSPKNKNNPLIVRATISISTKKATTFVIAFRDPAGTRTQDPNIKSVVLYRLSY